MEGSNQKYILQSSLLSCHEKYGHPSGLLSLFRGGRETQVHQVQPVGRQEGMSNSCLMCGDGCTGHYPSEIRRPNCNFKMLDVRGGEVKNH